MAGTAGNGLFVRLYVDADITCKLAQTLRAREFEAKAVIVIEMNVAESNRRCAPCYRLNYPID